MDWWELPGPASFADDIANDLRDGRNVIVCLPECVPDKLRKAVRSSLEKEHCWETLDCNDMVAESPLDWLYERFPCADVKPQDLREIQRLVEFPTFQGKVLWLEGISPETWSRWRAFLERYEGVCRNTPELGRTVFCAPVIGENALSVPKEDVCMSIRRFAGRVSHLDMQLFVENRPSNVGSFNILEEVRLEIIASLAQWDGRLCDRLMEKPLRNLIDEVEQYLVEEARLRSWNGEAFASYEEDWVHGRSDEIGGRRTTHSCICALKDPRELRRRIWAAQLRVLFPYIEEQRQLIIDRVASLVRLPYVLRNGEVIDNIRDLEIAHLESILRNHRHFQDEELLDRLAALKCIRNHLAHLEVVGYVTLNRDAVVRPLSRESDAI